MRGFGIIGLGLLVCVSAARAGDDGIAARGSAVARDAPAAESRPAAASAPAVLLPDFTGARGWLQAAIDVSRELADKDEEPDTEELKQAAAAMRPADAFPYGEEVARFPRDSHVARYAEARPWSWYYAPRHVRQQSPAVPEHRPQLHDAQALRDLLRDGDPAMRAIAAEALATLHRPEDVALLGRLLDDQAPASPFLGHNRSLSSYTILGVWARHVRGGGDGLDLRRSWHAETVAQCAQRALRLMTGMRFDGGAAFDEWWKANSDGRSCLWYWQQRLERELDEADILTSWPRLYQRPDETWERYRARRQALNAAARAEVHRTVAAELRGLAPEVEAKVRLLTVSEHAGGAPITGSEGQFWPDPPDLRVSADRLLDLLDRKGLWPDVPWDEAGRGVYNLLAERLGMWAGVLFGPAHVPRLRAALERERDRLGWSGQAAMVIGISRLLPPAAEGGLDDPDTRDGVLRQAVRGEGDLFVRDYCARELACVGLPVNGSFLKDAAFATRKDDPDGRIAQGILRALAQPPLTPQKREFLVELVLDRRFEPFWTRANARMGMDMGRQYGIWAINAHAGRELIGDSIRNRLTDPAASGEALAELREAVARLRAGDGPRPEPATLPAAPVRMGG